MSSRRSRFLNLERDRGERSPSEEPSRLGDGSRFESVGGPREAPLEAAIPEAHLERFKRQAEAPLALEQEQADALSFHRCMRCHAENGRFAPRCAMCGADLGTPEQREYTEQRRQAQQQEEARVREALAAQEREAKQRRAEAAFGGMVEQLRAEERRRSWLFWFSWMEGHGSLGLGLLRLIPHRGVRLAVGVGCALVPLALLYSGGRLGQLAGFCLGVLLLMVFIPIELWGTRR